MKPISKRERIIIATSDPRQEAKNVFKKFMMYILAAQN
jgi:hypothetical protein